MIPGRFRATEEEQDPFAHPGAAVQKLLGDRAEALGSSLAVVAPFLVYMF